MTVSAYEALAALIERELALVAEREFGELAEVQQIRVQLQNGLPGVPPAAAGSVLKRCGLLQKRLDIEYARIREAILIELGQLRHARQAAEGYAPVRARPTGRFVSASA